MIHFVGAGPGAVDLITVRGMRLIGAADVIVYAGSLVNEALLSYAKEDAKVYDSSAMTLEEVLSVMAEAEGKGETTVRLHTGDPSLYGAIREQMDALQKEGTPFDVTPGVSSFLAAAAALKIEYTLPGITQSLIITRMAGRTAVPERETIASFASHGATMCVFLSAGMTQALTRELIAGGYREDTPAAIAYMVSWGEEKLLLTTVKALSKEVEAHGIKKTALILVGDAIAQCGYERSKLYDPSFSTAYRRAESVPQEASFQIACFTDAGEALAARLLKELKALHDVRAGSKRFGEGRSAMSLSDWTREHFREGNTLLFIGASGIAVRAIAPFLENKTTDPAVLITDERGQHVIPLLSGHMGGANKEAARVAAITKGVAVLTTATDVNRLFSIDVFAKEHHLTIADMAAAKRFSAALLKEKEAYLLLDDRFDLPEECTRELPAEINIIRGLQERENKNAPVFSVSPFVQRKEDKALFVQLIPRVAVAGCGCRKGKDAEALISFLQELLLAAGVEEKALCAVSTIDVKRDEKGINQMAYRFKVPLYTFTAGELKAAEGTFSSSAFVEETVGVDNVCERAVAVMGAEVLLQKHSRDGMTLAVGMVKGRLV